MITVIITITVKVNILSAARKRLIMHLTLNVWRVTFSYTFFKMKKGKREKYLNQEHLPKRDSSFSKTLTSLGQGIDSEIKVRILHLWRTLSEEVDMNRLPMPNLSPSCSRIRCFLVRLNINKLLVFYAPGTISAISGHVFRGDIILKRLSRIYKSEQIPVSGKRQKNRYS